MDYTHKDGHREVTATGSARDRELAARAADGRTSWRRTDDEDKAARWVTPDAGTDDTLGA